MMKRIKKILLLLYLSSLWMLPGCDEPPVERPENLIGEEKMIDMLVDIHLAEAAFFSQRTRDSLVEKSSSADFYYSVLQKYEVPDSVFEKSFVFYASQPRDFEKMYRQVMNQINEMEQEFSGRKQEQLQVNPMEKQE